MAFLLNAFTFSEGADELTTTILRPSPFLKISASIGVLA